MTTATWSGRALCQCASHSPRYGLTGGWVQQFNASYPECFLPCALVGKGPRGGLQVDNLFMKRHKLVCNFFLRQNTINEGFQQDINTHHGHCTMELVYTKDGTFNFWALEVTDLVKSKLLICFCRINWVQDRLSLDYEDPCSSSPVSQRLTLLSGL